MPSLSTLDSPLQIEWDTAPLAPEWDSFVESSPGGHHEQTSRWGQVRSAYGWRVGRLLLRDGSSIVAGAQVMIRPLRRSLRWTYVTYGPLFSRNDPVLEATMIAELKSLASRLGAAFMVIGLPYQAHRLASCLPAAGLYYKPPRVQPHFIQTTCVIDLAKTPDEMLANMRRSTRQNVRNALSKGIIVTERGVSDLGIFRELMVNLCQRRGTTPNPPYPDFFQRLWEQFAPKGWIKLFIAAVESEPVSAAVAFTFNGWVRVWKVGWSGQHSNRKPNELMWWEMIQWAHRNGFSYFDFVEVDAAVAAQIATGGSADNVTGFKLGFGGEICHLPGAYCYVPNPLIRIMLRLGLMRLLDSPIALKFVRSVASSSG